MPKINQEEYEVLKDLDDKWKWIARDKDGTLIIFAGEAIRYSNKWYPPENVGDSITVDELNAFKEITDQKDLFRFIKWEDEEPYNIQELIEEYLYDNQPKLFIDGQEQSFEFIEESEEKEVKKNIEWLKSAIQQNLDFYNDNDEEWQMAKVRAYAKSLDLINQLDEPEVNSQIDKLANFIMSEVEGEPSQNQGAVDTAIRIIKSYQNQETLSQEWIDEHKETIFDLDEDFETEFIKADDLQNLLVPKQELPVIPKFVAEWIESRDYYNVYKALQDLSAPGSPHASKDVRNWIFRNQENVEKFVRAWIDGYTVEEEQKYYAKIKGHENIYSDICFWIYDTEIEELLIDDAEIYPDVTAGYMIKATKDEWANLGINDDNADFVKVEELEE